MAFFEKDRVVKLELTGTDYKGDTGFFGLRLGDGSDKVLEVLGKPTEIRHEDDVDVDLWDYKNANYSVEMTKDRRLYSIQIVDEEYPMPKSLAGKEDARTFAKAIRAGEVDRVVEMSSGEIECKAAELSDVRTGAARTVLSDRDSAVSVCLRRAADAVLSLGPEMNGVEDEIRVWPEAKNHPSSGLVSKFPSSSPLKEIVFVLESGGWRVYEVTFR